MSRAQRDWGLHVGGFLQAGSHPANYRGCDQRAPRSLQEWQLPQHILRSNIPPFSSRYFYPLSICLLTKPVCRDRKMAAVLFQKATWEEGLSIRPRDASPMIRSLPLRPSASCTTGQFLQSSLHRSLKKSSSSSQRTNLVQSYLFLLLHITIS